MSLTCIQISNAKPKALSKFKLVHYDIRKA
jgi:hypothetical protein